MRIDWSDYPNFSAHEFRCKHTGRNEMDPEFVRFLQKVRSAYGKPMRVTSGYRAPEHPIEAVKSRPGAHASGRAADIAVGPGEDVYDLVRIALAYGAQGVGISQRINRPRFVHLDTVEHRRAIWSY